MNTDMIWQTSSTSSADTERLGELLGRQLKGGETIELRSDLGGGKTTFVRGLAAGAGSQTRVSSPTFTLNRIYRGKKFDIHHFDFYRLSEAGIMSEQLEESLDNPHAVTVVEWGGIVKDVMPKDRLSIEFKLTPRSPDERLIVFAYPEAVSSIITKLETAWLESQP